MGWIEVRFRRNTCSTKRHPVLRESTKDRKGRSRIVPSNSCFFSLPLSFSCSWSSFSCFTDATAEREGNKQRVEEGVLRHAWIWQDDWHDPRTMKSSCIGYVGRSSSGEIVFCCIQTGIRWTSCSGTNAFDGRTWILVGSSKRSIRSTRAKMESNDRRLVERNAT